MRKIALLIFVLSLFLTWHAHAQTPSIKLKDVAAKLDKFSKEIPIEKAHLHLDKPYYSVGDTIWVKAYVVDRDNALSNISNLLYVDLIDSKDSIKTSLTIPVINGLGWSAIALDDSIYNAGNYSIRAYTTVMRNYGADYFYNRGLTIVNALPLKPGENTTPANSTIPAVNSPESRTGNISLQFFPEGGSLVVGIASKVAFKAIGPDGLSRDVSGYIIDKDNNRLADFKSGHAGMGTFRLFPTPGNSYSAVVTINGAEARYPLPKAESEGYGLSVIQNEDNLQVRIVATTSSGNSKTLNLIAQAKNQVLYSGRAELKNSGFTTSIPKKHFTEGIVQITLLNAEFKPVAERLIFISYGRKGININLSNADRKKEGRSTFKINVTDEDRSTTQGAFSMAITNEGKVPYNEEDEISIHSNLLLAADLKGYIEQPNYYFTNPSPAKERELDNLLLTQGWRKFVWDDILQDRALTATYKPETGDITGVVLAADNKPVADAKVTLLFTNGNKMALDTVANAQGRFVFYGVWPDKNDKYIVSATDKRQKTRYTVELDKQLLASPPIVKQPFISPKASQLEVYQKTAKKDFEELQSKGLLGNPIVLKEVKVTEKKKAPTIQDIALTGSTNLGGKGRANAVVTFKDLLPCGGGIDLGGCLTSIGKLINVDYRRDPRDPSAMTFYARGNGGSIGGNAQPMAIIQDGVPVQTFMGSINDIASIEILRSVAYSAIYGSRGAGGVILINTKRGGVDYSAYETDGESSARTSMPPLSNMSFAPRREFYVPKYDAAKNNARPQQATVYWAPNIITDLDGSAVVEFPAEAPGRYKIVIEGVDVNGNLGRKIVKYDVN